MALVIEDGSVVSGADSYVSVEEVVTYCASRGIVIPTDQTELEILIRKAFDYVESFSYIGTKPPEQETQWPRTNDSFEGIPYLLKKAQSQAVGEFANAPDPFVDPEPKVKKEKIDVLETEYFEPPVNLEFTKESEKFLKPLLRGWPQIKVSR